MCGQTPMSPHKPTLDDLRIHRQEAPETKAPLWVLLLLGALLLGGSVEIGRAHV